MARNKPHRASIKKPRTFFKSGESVRLTYGLLGNIVSAAGPNLFNIKHADGRIARYHATQFSRV